MSRRSVPRLVSPASSHRMLLHLSMLLMLLVQSLPVGTAIAAPVPAAATTPTTAQCVPGTAPEQQRVSAGGIHVSDCAVTMERAEPVSTALDAVVSAPDGVEPVYTLGAAPEHGAASLVGSTLTYTPTFGFAGEDRVIYRVADRSGRDTAGVVSFVVGAAAEEPIASQDAASGDSVTASQTEPTILPQTAIPPTATTVMPTATATAPSAPLVEPTATRQPSITVVAADMMATTPTTVGTISGVDLSIAALDATPAGQATQPVTVAWTIHNGGDRAARSHVDRLYFSTDDQWQENDTLLTSVSVTTTLAAGSQYRRAGQIGLPNVAAGTYYLLLFADARGHVTEADETNNLAAIPIVISRPPDLAPTQLFAPAGAAIGAAVDVRWRVFNRDDGPAGPHVDALYLSSDTTWQSDDPVLATVAITDTVAGKTRYDRVATIQVPALPSGDYFLIVRTDIRGEIGESSEGNNGRVVPISVTQAPVAEDAVYTIGLTETITVDLATLSTDPDGDPLTYSLPVSPSLGLARLVTSTLTYTPTTSFTETEVVRYRADDGKGGTAEGTLTFTTIPTRLHVTPGSALFTAAGQSRLFSVRAFDPLGREVSTTGMQLEWFATDPSVVGIAPGAGGATATLTSLADLGSATVAVRSGNNPDVESALLTVTIAQPEVNTQLVADTQIAFPPPNPLPNQPGDTAVPGTRAMAGSYRATASGTTVGGFTADEIKRAFSAVGDYSAGQPVTSFRYPVILQGPAPAVGQILVSHESAPVMGRVVRILGQRNGFVLAQLELVDFTQAFKAVKFDVRSSELIDAGFATSQQFMQQEPSADTSAPTLIGPPAPSAQRQLPGPLRNCEGDVQGVPIELKPFTINFDPDLIFAYESKVDSKGQKYAELIEAGIKLNATLQAGLNLNFQAGFAATITCPLGDGVKLRLPNVGMMALVNLLIGPTFKLVPQLVGELKVQGGPRFAADVTLKAEVEASKSVRITNPNNTGRKFEFPGEFDFKPGFEPTVDYPDDLNEVLSWKVEAKIGLYETGHGLFILGGGIWDLLGRIPGLDDSGGVGELQNRLSLDFFNAKIGPELKIERSSAHLVRTAKANGSGASILLVAEGVLESKALEALAEKMGRLKVLIPEVKIFEFNTVLLPIYTELKDGKVVIQEGDMVKEGEMATFEATASGPNLFKVDLYYKGVHQFTLSHNTGTAIVAKHPIPKALCDAAKSEYIELEAIGYNPVFNGTFFGARLPHWWSFPNWLGTVKMICTDFKVDMQIVANGQPVVGDQTVMGCVWPNRGPELPIGVVATARDRLSKLTELKIVGLKADHVVAGEFVPELNASYDVIVGRGDPATYTIYAEALAKGENTAARREKTKPITLTVKWVGCRERSEFRSDWRAVDECFQVPIRQEKKTRIYFDLETGATLKREVGEWGEWRVSGPQESRGECRGRTVPRPRGRGDPHIITADGREYDSFALGEFIYLQPRAGRTGMTIQTRQQRVESGTLPGEPIYHPWTSYNTAVAIRAGDTTFEFRQGELTRPLVNGQRQSLRAGLHSFGAVDIKVNSARQVELSWQGYSVVLDQVWTFIEIAATVPRDNSHHGMLGTPNGREADDFQRPDGTDALNAFDLADSWRVRTAAQSLFTYARGQGPQTFNLPQINEPPSREQLAPFLEQARQVLINTCRADTISEVAINNTALELFTGRTAQELASTGLCWYMVQGTVMNSLVPDLPVPGAMVTITSGESGSCTTYTDRRGFYSCSIPAQGQAANLTVRVSGRGSAEAVTSFAELPPMEGTLTTWQDLTVAPTTLRMIGDVKDSLQRPLYNAEVRVAGPASAGPASKAPTAFAVADGNGGYSTYLMFNDGVLNGNTSYHVTYNPRWSRDPLAPGVVYDFTRVLPELRPNALNVVRENLVLAGSVVRFTGKVAYQYRPQVTLPGVRVLITPTTPVEGWTGCDVRTLRLVSTVRNPRLETNDAALAGNYVCDVPLNRTEPFQARVQIAGQETSELVTIEPAGRGVGDTIPVVADLLVPSGMLQIGGLVREADGKPVPDANLSISSPGALHDATARTDATGRYTATLALRANTSSAEVSLSVQYGSLSRSQKETFTELYGGVLNRRTVNLSLSGRMLELSGRIINTLAPTTPLTGTLVIASGTRTLCTIDVPVGAYQCEVALNTGLETSIPLQYTMTGPWGRITDSASVTQLPATGERRSFVRDLAGQATTLRLRGFVRTVSGRPLPGATVRVASGRIVEGKTAPDGSYDLLLMLNEGPGERLLDYTVTYRGTPVTESHMVAVEPMAIKEVTRDFSYGMRLLTFRGKVSNPYNIALPYSEVRITAPELAAPCVTQTAADGSYYCATQSGATAPFSATYTISGIWGSRNFVERVPIVGGQDQPTTTADLLVTPTALRLRGQVTAPNGVPLANVALAASGTTLYREAQGTTNADGTYDFYAILKPPTGADATAPFTRSLALRAGYGTAVTTRIVRFTARPNELADATQDVVLEARTVRFTGTVVNQHAPQEPLLGSRVVVVSPQLGVLCEWNVATRYGTNAYTCDAPIQTADSFDVEYRLSGTWGTAVVTGTVASVPEPGAFATVSRNLNVRPTTLLLRGRVTDRDTVGVAGTPVMIASSGFGGRINTTTDKDGNYRAYVVLRSGVTEPVLNYTVDVNGEPSQQRQVGLSVVPGSLTTRVENFTFHLARRLELKGTLANQTHAATRLSGRLLIVAPNLNQTLCDTVIANGAYTCTTLVRTEEAIAVNYRVEAPWGGLTLLNQSIPAGATSHVQALTAAPRMLRLSGVVRNGAVGLLGANVVVEGTSLVNRAINATTLSDGRYNVYAVLREGVAAGDLLYSAALNGNQVTAQGRFSFGSGNLLQVAQDLSLTSRVLVFRGALKNTLLFDARAWPQSRVVVSSPQLGRLCEAPAAAGYQCSTVLTGAEPFDVVYTVSGAWGSSTATGRVSELPAAGGRDTVVQDLEITPTMLRVTGRAVDNSGAPVAGVLVQARSSMIATVERQDQTDVSGRYEVLLLLREVSGTQSGLLQLDATFRNATVTVNVPFTATAGTITDVNADTAAAPIELKQRTLVVRGDLVNTLAPNVAGARPSAQITVRSPAGADWCATQHGTNYVCTIVLYEDEPIDVIVTARGDWGSATRRERLSDIPAPDGRSEVRVDLQATATTLRMTGRVTLPGNAPLAGASVRIQQVGDEQLRDLLQLRADSAGQYDGYLVLPALARDGLLRYTVDHGGIQTQFETDGPEIRPNELIVQEEDFTFTPRRVRFTGTLTHQRVSGMPLPGTVSITSPDLWSARYCQATINPSSGAWSCDATVLSSEPFSVTYRFTGTWGTLDTADRVADVPGPGGTVVVEQHAQASPTTLRLSGTVLDTDGEALGGAIVRVTGANLIGTATATTNGDGEYSVDAVVTAGTTQGTLLYTISYYRATLQQSHAYAGLNRGVVNPIVRTFELESRELTFNGQVLHRDIAELALPGVVRVSGPSGMLCETTTDAQGGYLCHVPAAPTAAFTATYTISGDWGSQSLRVPVGQGEAGGSNTETRDLAVTPTTLRLHGVVRTPDNAPLAGVVVKAVGPDLSTVSAATSATTDQDGAYSMHVIVRSGVRSGVLQYQIRKGTTRGAIVVPWTAPANRVTPLEQDLRFATRDLRFTGVVRNTLAPSLVLAGARVDIRAAGLGDLCSATTGADGAFECQTEVLNTERFRVEYSVVSAWGRLVYGGMVEAGPAGGTTTTERALGATPTTLRLHGVVTGADGAPLQGAEVSATGARLLGNPSATTGQNGAYELFLMASAGTNRATIDYVVKHAGRTLRYSFAHRFDAGVLTSLPRDYTFAVRNFRFTGELRNTHAPEMPLRATSIDISSPTHGSICVAQTAALTNSYECAAEINTTTPFTVEYRVAGDWGESVVTATTGATLPPIGGEVSLQRDIEISPTTAIFQGFVRGGNNAALPDAEVKVISNTHVSGLNLFLRDVTRATGAYTLPVILKAGSTAGTIEQHVTRSGIELQEALPFSVAPNGSVAVVKNWTIATRRVVFSGRFHNTRVTDNVDARLINADQVVISSPGLGELCRWQRSSPGVGAYTCNRQVATTEPFSVTYQVNADWGAATLTGTVAAGDWGATTFADRDLEVTPTTVRLVGSVVRSNDGNGVPGVSIGVTGNALSQVMNWGGNTGPGGTYEFYAVLREGVTSGTLNYRAVAGAILLDDSRSFTANPAEITDISKTLTVGQRQVTFAGQIRHARLSSQSVGASRVTISSPVFGQLCTWAPAQQVAAPSYTCSQVISGTAAFSVTYQVSGDWGTEVMTGTVPAGTAGTPVAVNRALDVAPAMLKLTGTVFTPDRLRQQGVSVMATGPAISFGTANRSGTTNAEGNYQIYVVLVDDVISGTLGYEMSYRGAIVREDGPFEAVEHEISPVEDELTFGARAIAFNGSVRHKDLPWMTLPSTALDVTAPGSGELCRWRPFHAQGAYSCAGQLGTTDPVSVTYTITGTWGTDIFTGTVPANDWASLTSLNKDLLVAPTTLKLTGTISDTANRLLQGARVIITGDALVEPVEEWTDANGDYEVFALVKGGLAAGTLNYKVTYGAGQQTTSTSFTATPRAITTIDKGFRFSSRRVELRGTVLNTVLGGQPLNIKSVTMESPAFDQACVWTNPWWNPPTANYSCDKEVLTSDAFEVTYTVAEDWGTTVVTATVPAAAAGTTRRVTRDIEASPTTLQITGAVRDPQSAGLPEAYVEVKGASLSSANPSYSGWVSTQTTATGAYTMNLLLKAGVTSGSLSYRVSYANAQLNETRGFEAPEGGLGTTTQTFTITQRFVRFQGDVLNALANDAELLVREVSVSSPQHGHLCSYSSSSTSYSCSVPMPATTPFSVTYAITGTWGTAVVSGPSVSGDVAIGQTQQIEHDLRLSPTTLRLHGTVTQGTSGLANAYVRVEGDVLADTWSTPSDTTDGNGAYEFFAVLKTGVTSGTLQLKVNSSGVTQTEEVPFSATGDALTPVEANVAYSARQINFNGQIVHATIASSGIGATRVVVSSGGQELCRFDSPYGDYPYYGCTGYVRTSEPFTATYTVTGGWGTEVITSTEAITPPAVGASTNVARNVGVAPAMVRLHGTVKDAANNPLNPTIIVYASQSLVAPFQFQMPVTNGVYNLYVPVKGGVTEGSVQYAVSLGVAQAGETKPFTATWGTIAEVEQNFTLRERRLRFIGTVKNGFDPGGKADVPATTVAISDATRGLLCVSQAYSTEGMSHYDCSTIVTTTDVLDLSYAITGTWGTEVVAGGTVTQFPTVGATTNISRDPVVSPTTLHLEGVVENPGQVRLQGARVDVRSPIFAGQSWGNPDGAVVSATADAQGRYHVYAPIRSDVTGGTLKFVVHFGSASMDAGSLEVQGLLANTRNDRPRDFAFNRRSVSFSGEIVNALVPGEPVHATAITITDQLGNVLCTASETTSFWCQPDVAGEGEFTATITASGGWGETSATVVVPAGQYGSNTEVNRDVAVTATTLRVRGVVAMPNGERVDWAEVTIDGPDVLSPVEVDTDELGRYDAYVAIGNVATGTLTVSVRNDWDAVKTTTVDFSAVIGALRNVTHNITFDVRGIGFDVNIMNALRQGEWLDATKLVISSPTLGTLCTVSEPDGDDRVYCEAAVTTTSAFSATFTVTGIWGTEVFTETVPAGVIGESIWPRYYLRAHPRMVRLTGTVTDASSTPAGNVLVEVQGEALAHLDRWSLRAWTAGSGPAAGTYEIHAVLPAGVTGGTITYKLTGPGGASLTEERTFTAATPAAVNTVTQNFTLAPSEP